jgi:hypothetical protein
MPICRQAAELVPPHDGTTTPGTDPDRRRKVEADGAGRCVRGFRRASAFAAFGSAPMTTPQRCRRCARPPRPPPEWQVSRCAHSSHRCDHDTTTSVAPAVGLATPSCRSESRVSRSRPTRPLHRRRSVRGTLPGAQVELRRPRPHGTTRQNDVERPVASRPHRHRPVPVTRRWETRTAGS